MTVVEPEARCAPSGVFCGTRLFLWPARVLAGESFALSTFDVRSKALPHSGSTDLRE